jgi:hypothetical protein
VKLTDLLALVTLFVAAGQSARGQYDRGAHVPYRIEPLPSLDEPASNLPEEASNCGAPLCTCPEDRTFGGVAVYAYEAFRGIADGGWENNGAHAGVNYSLRLGEFTDATRLRAQFGGSIGVYNWSGTDYRMHRQDDPQTQGMVTYGLYRRADENSPWSVGIVNDWMINSNFGVFGLNPTLSQLRAQVGYTLSDSNEIGLWGSIGVLGDNRDVPSFGDTRWEAVNQLSMYWRHKWEYGADTLIWFGVPEQSRLTGDGTLGDYFVGARADAPLNDRFAAYSLVTYMHPSAHIGPAAARDDEWSFIVGIAFYPGRDSRSPTVHGFAWQPLVPVATNGTFLVDTTNWY